MRLQLNNDTPDIIYTLMKMNEDNTMIYKACRDAIFHNGQLLNILKAMTILAELDYMFKENMLSTEYYSKCADYLSEMSGYSKIELFERLEY